MPSGGVNLSPSGGPCRRSLVLVELVLVGQEPSWWWMNSMLLGFLFDMSI